MRYIFFVFAVIVATIVAIGCEKQEAIEKSQIKTENESIQEQSKRDEAPLLLDDEPLLLLDDEPEGDLSGQSEADNSRCFVCHINYAQEDIAVTHARAGIGCASCHGESDKHIADESWASGGNGTAPDVMFPRPRINLFCMGCHPKEKIETEEHKPLFTTGAQQKYCTDCHGEHRLTNRKCKWK
jgi:hypothetical protein